MGVVASDNGESPAPAIGPTGWRWWLACGIVLALVLAATVPTTGDIGLTWDEPAYRYSQVLSAQWWERLAQARTRSDLHTLFEPDTLLYYWPYGRHGINFHPPLAGQLNLATYAVFGRWMKDIPARRLASVFEYALTITIGFGFLARRYGSWVGGMMAGALLFMPRVYGDGHIAGTDAPGLLLWAATSLAFWKGLHEPQARRWRVAVGVLVGLAFVEKMAAVLVFLPLLAWLAVSRLPRALIRPGDRADWIDGALTIAALLAPLGIASAEVLRLSHTLPPPASTNLFIVRPATALPGAILAVPLLVWIARQLLGRVFRNHPVWGVERPALEMVTATLAFAPVVAWLGNPAWWRETLPRLTHYYLLSTARRGALPNIQILYLGQTYEYSLPWHNAGTLIAITVPASILAAAVAGVVVVVLRLGLDRLPLFFLANLATLPVMRMLPTPAHDGVRLFLPTFFFLAGLAGWGAVGVANGLARLLRVRAALLRGAVATLVLLPAAWQLIKIHPFELSYYNELVGGPRGAWNAGFELAYWYDAFNGRTLAALNRTLPPGAVVDFLNLMSDPPTFFELQALGELRGDIVLGARSPDEFPFVWLLTQDSKATAFTRLLFAMRPWFALEPRQLDGLRVATVAAPEAVARAWALQLLADARDTDPPDSSSAPEWVHRHAPWLGRFWGEGVTRVHRLRVNEPLFDWAQTDPKGLRTAARAVAEERLIDKDQDARRLLAMLSRYDQPSRPGGRFAERLLKARPQALVEAVAIVIEHPDAVRTVLTRCPYTDPKRIGGYLDRDLAEPES
jgi:hypothetical protein